MKNIYYFLFSTLCYFFPFAAQAQTTQRCVSDERHKNISEKFPAVETNHRILENDYRAFIENRQNRANKSYSGSKYIIPVVFHVIHRPIDNSEGLISNVSEERILQQIEILNQDFRNIGGTNFSGNSVDTQIEFQLAKKDPYGNCHSGIIRVSSALSVGVDWHNYAGDSVVKALSHWPNDRYLNIYVVYSLWPDALGYATFPWETGTPQLDTVDGVVIRYDALGLNGNGEIALGRTATHEVGHWLGLYHTFQPTLVIDPNTGNPSYWNCLNDTCHTQGDKVCDTPPIVGATSINLSCTATPNTCTTDDDDLSANNPFRPVGNGGLGDQNDLISNFMDYSSDSCMNNFTAGQLTRIDFYINSTRAPIWNAANITQTGLSGLTHDFDSVQVSSGLNGRVTAMCVWNDKLIIAGDFTLADGIPCTRIVAWNGSSYENLNNVPWNMNGITCMAAYKGKLYVGGTFTIVNEGNFIMSYDGAAWDNLCTNSDFRSTSDPVRSLWVYKDKLYVGGDFGSVDGLQISASRIATWDGTSWAALGTGLTGGSAACYAMSVHNGKLVIGGRFSSANGVACDKVVFYDGTTFTSPSTGTNNVNSGRLNSLYSYSGQLFTGGDYYSVGGNLLTGLTQYNGTNWSTTSGSAYGINRFALQNFNGLLWVGGHISDLDAPVHNIYTYNPAANSFTTVTSEHKGLDNSVLCMAQYKDELYIGGEFNVLQGMNGNPDKNFDYICKVKTICTDPLPVGAQDNGTENTELLKVYPNPANEWLTVENVKNQIRVFNIFGEEIFAQTLNDNAQKFELVISMFSAGVYFIQSEKQTAKFVKQ